MTVLRSTLIRLGLGCTMAVLVTSEAAAAKPYPVNACVSVKQRQVGRYCRAVLSAWSAWESSQNDGGRDAALQAAASALDADWNAADAAALARGTNCAETTLSSAAAEQKVQDVVGGIVTEVNGGLTLGNRPDAKCGARLLAAAAHACDGLLGAESRFVRALADDPHGTARAAKRARAQKKFVQAWNKATRDACPTSADSGDIRGRVTTLADALVRDTTVSPNVDDTQYTTYSPTGPIEYQGKSLTPICMDSSPYSFFAKRGTVNKLLVYYQGGGACWETLTCSAPACDTNVDSSDNPNNAHSGFADLSNPANPFKDWNTVFVSYCSCDVHFGDAAQDYPPHVEHRGYENSRVVEKWAREHFVNPEVVFVTGSSAGAYGAWFNAPLHERVWPASRFQVLADAGNGVITQEFLQTFFPNWNFAANFPPDIPEIQQVISNGSGIPGYTKVVADLFPETRWAHYATAYDGGSGGQTGFYNLMLHHNNPIFALTWWQGSCAFNSVMRAQAIATAAEIPSNYRYYIGTGSRHTMWGSNKVYNDTTGGVPRLVDWVNAMLDGTPAWTNVECTNCGLTLPGDPVPAPLHAPFFQVGSDVVVQCPMSSPSGAFLDAASD